MTPEEVNDRLERELGHVATKEEDANLRTDFHREMTIQTRWIIGAMIALQVPTWIGMIQLWSALGPKHL